MTENDDLVRRLEAMGRDEPPPPSPRLLARLTPDQLRGRAMPAPRPSASRLRLPVLLPAAAVAALVLGFVLLVVGRGDGDGGPRTIVIATAADASVQQATQSVPAAHGLTLAEGDQLVTGPAGRVIAGGITLGPEEVAVVRGGRLRRLRRALATTTTTAPPATVAPPVTAAPPGPPAPSPTPTTAAPPTTEAPAPTSTTIDQRSVPVTLELVGRRTRTGAVGLLWTRYDGPSFGSYVVLREDRTIVARRCSVDGRQAADRDPPTTDTRYVVVVLDADRRPVARSQVIRL